MKTRIYAIGDVHGRKDLLEDLYEMIAADAALEGAGRNVLVHLGDYVDRGPDSAGVIKLVRGGLAGFESIALLGNHEALMIEFLVSGDERSERYWRTNGGTETSLSFGVPLWGGALDREGLAAAVGPDLLGWLATLRLSHEEGGFFFAHAGILPGRPLDQQANKDLIWIREAFLESPSDHGRRIVHGHTPETDPQVRPNRIGIDTGAVWTGRLTAARLDPAAAGDEPAFLMTAGPTLEEILAAR